MTERRTGMGIGGLPGKLEAGDIPYTDRTYLTVEVFEQACEAIDHHRTRAEAAEAALKEALEDVWAVESHAAKGTSLEASRDARIIEKGMLQLARHRIEEALEGRRIPTGANGH